MYTHKLYIDGEDILADYGVGLVQGSVASFVQVPQYKTLKSNDWQEHSGLEVDLSDPKFKAQDFDLRITGRNGAVRSFAEQFSTLEHHEMSISGIPIELDEVRVHGVKNYTQSGIFEAATLSCTFDGDWTPILTEYEGETAQTQTVTAPMGFNTLAGGNFGKYGIQVLDGWRSQLYRPREVKEAMGRDISTVPGIIHYSTADPTGLTYKERQIQLDCLLHGASSQEEFWRLYLSFMCSMAAGGSMIIVTEDNTTFRSYYGGMSVTDYAPTEPSPWMRFRLTLKLFG